MATAYKSLGQVAPSATTLTTLYTPTAGNAAAISTIAICNRASTSATYRLAHRLAGASISNEMYFAYDAVVDANDTVYVTAGITPNGTDVISVYASNGNLSFNAWGVENP